MGRRKRKRPPSILARNWLFIVLFNGVWALGNPFINQSTTITAFFSELDVQPYIYGVVSLSACLPVLIQILPRCCRIGSDNPRIPIYITYSFTGAGYILYGVLASMADKDPGLFVPLLLAVYFAISCTGQLALVMYLNYLTMLFPANYLGRVYGVVGLAQAVAGVLSGLILLPLVMNRWSFPDNYGILFGFAGFIFLVAVQFSLFTKKQMSPQNRPPCQGPGHYLRVVRAVLQKPAARRFCLMMILVHAGNVSAGFILPHLRRQEGMVAGADVLRTLTLISYCSQAVLMPLIGLVTDKVGRRFALNAYMVCVAAANLLLVTRLPGHHFPIYMVFGMYSLFNNMVTVRFAGETIEETDRYDAIIIANIASVLCNAALSALYGLLATALGGYSFIFILCAVFSLLVIPVAGRKNQAKPNGKSL